jgi:hypothetical protein
MAANEVVLYFDKHEDAVLFILAPVPLCPRKGWSKAAVQGIRLRRRFAKPVKSRLRVF